MNAIKLGNILRRGLAVAACAAICAGTLRFGPVGTGEKKARAAELSDPPEPYALTVNDSEAPLGLDADDIRFGWKLRSDAAGKAQTAYEIVVREGETEVWRTGKVQSTDGFGIPYGGEPLKDKTRYDWSVKVWDENDRTSREVSSTFETGITDWEGIDWIGGAGVKLLKNVFRLTQPLSALKSARVYITGQGLFEFHMNGEIVGDYVLTPPPSEYYSRAFYVTYDVEEYLKEGDNVFGIMLGFGKKGMYYDDLRMARMCFEAIYENGETDRLVTGENCGWAMSTQSPITRDTYFRGEDRDTRMFEGWDSDPVIRYGDAVFRSGQFDGEQTLDTDRGEYVVHSNVAQLLPLVGEYGEFRLEMRLKLDDTKNAEPAVGIVFGAQNENNYYMWQINFLYNQLRPHKLTQGAWSTPYPAVSLGAAALGEWFDFALEVKGTTVTAEIGGRQVSSVTLPAPTEGFLALRFAGGLGDPAKGETLRIDSVKLTSGGETKLDQTFGREIQPWTEAESFEGNVLTEGGVLRLLGSNAFTSQAFSDFIFEADVTVLESGENCFGLYFRKQRSNDAYMWQVNLGLMQLRCHRLQNGAWDIPEGGTVPLPSSVALGTSFRFRLEAEGDRITCFINDQKLNTLSDDCFETGRIGFRLEAGEANVIDNVRITDIHGYTTLFEDDFEDPEKTAENWIFPTRYDREMTALNTFTVIDRTYEPVSMREVSKGKYLIDFGQNMSGYVRLKDICGARGSSVKVSYAEHLSADGNDINGDSLSGSPLVSGSDVYHLYILNGEVQTLRPSFTYTGFQYVTVEVSDGGPALTRDNVEACFVTEEMAQIGDFSCADDVINGVMQIYIAAQKSNDIGLFLASPHREKDGWLADAAVTSESVNYIFDSDRLYEKFFLDMIDNTYEGDLTYADGLIRVFVPHVPTGDHSIADPPWQSGRFTMVYNNYRTTGSTASIRKSYHAMKLTIEYFRSLQTSPDSYRIDANSFCDWLGFDNRNGRISPPYISTAYYYHAVDLMEEMAAAIGEEADAAMYADLKAHIAARLNADWLVDNRYYDNDTQSSNAIALALGFVPEEARKNVVDSLVRKVEESNYIMKTGTLGCKAIFTALADAGRSDVLLKLAAQRNYPSLGYMYESGATTLWEYWEPYGYAMQYGPNFQSLNHNMYGGGYAAWCYQGLAGIRNDGVGYDKITIMPVNNIGEFSAKASTDTVRGVVSSEWKNEKGRYTLKVHIPVGSEARVCVPDMGRSDIVLKCGGETVFSQGSGKDGGAVKFGGYENGYLVCLCPSGTYEFELTGTDAQSAVREETDLSGYRAEENLFGKDVTVSEILGEDNPWTFDEENNISVSAETKEYMALFHGIPLEEGDRIYRGKLRFSAIGPDFWDGIRLVIGYESPTEFEVLDIEKGGVFFNRRTESAPTGWKEYRSVPKLFVNDVDYEIEIRIAEGKLYLDIDGERLMDGVELPADMTPCAFGIFDSKSDFTLKDIEVANLEKTEEPAPPPADPDKPDPAPGNKGEEEKLPTGMIVAISVSSAVLAACLALAIVLFVRKRKK